MVELYILKALFIYKTLFIFADTADLSNIVTKVTSLILRALLTLEKMLSLFVLLIFPITILICDAINFGKMLCL